jgi:4-hydroxybenzoate polyprenyltransferase/phosphoserine phosphatase
VTIATVAAARRIKEARSITPLVVDLDGTLTPTDTLWESLIRLARARPAALFLVPIWLYHGRANLKAKIAQSINWEAHDIPLNTDLIEYLRSQKDHRQIVLATAANQRIAVAVAKRIGLFDVVIASDDMLNVKGGNKLAAIRRVVGEHFVYAGDAKADLPIWSAAESSILVGGSSALRRRVLGCSRLEREFQVQVAGLSTWLKAVRIHQWTKNLLVLVPLLTSFSITSIDRLAASAMAFLAFSLAASATYLANDLWDLESDRVHPRKRLRPLAAGTVSIRDALGVAVMLLLSAFSIAYAISGLFAITLLVYVIVTTAYSWTLKRYVIADVLTLACLYAMRVYAGAVALTLPISSWLLAFSAFLFLGLALVKRCAELVSLEREGRLRATGRNYLVSDLRVLWPMGVGASLCAVVVFGLFISSPDVASRYASPQLVWFCALLLFYWLGRLWIKTARGEMHDDPIVFALRDPNSRVTVVGMGIIAIIAHSYPF